MIMMQNSKYFIEHDGEQYALVVKSSYKPNELDFLTQDSDLFQAGFISREAGYVVNKHSHNAFNTTIDYVSEFIFVRSGKIRVDMFSAPDNLIESIELETGDFILHKKGIHEVIFLEDSQVLEIKQGPYMGLSSKTFYEKVENN